MGAWDKTAIALCRNQDCSRRVSAGAKKCCFCSTRLSPDYAVWNFATNTFRSGRKPICSGCVHQARAHHLPARLFTIIYSCAGCCTRHHCRSECSGCGGTRSSLNLGTKDGNYTKDEIVGLVIKRLPETVVTYKDLTFGGDIRDISISFDKIHRELGFNAEMTVDDGVREVVHTLRTGIIRNPQDEKYTNARFIVQ